MLRASCSKHSREVFGLVARAEDPLSRYTLSHRGMALRFSCLAPLSRYTLSTKSALSHPFCLKLYQGQKNPRVRKIFVRNSGAGNGCANFMDAWKKSVRSAGKAMSIKLLVLGGGGYFGFWGGGAVPILFLWARGFF